jgi:hypothetical protein
VNVRRHHCTQRGEDETVALEAAQTAKPLRNDSNTEMPFPFAGAGMAGMKVTFVDDVELHRVERALQ